MTSRAQQLSDNLQAAFGDALASNTVAENDAMAEVTIEVAPAKLLAVCTRLRDDSQFAFEQLIDVCGVDYLE